MTKHQRRLYPWQIDRSNKPVPVGDPPKPPAIVAQVLRVTLSPREAAAAMGISLGTLQTLERAGQAPPSLVLPGGRRRLYPVDLLVRWAADRATAGQADGDEQHGGPTR